MDITEYSLTIVMNDGEKIETVVTASIINYLQVTHNNSEEFYGMIFAIEINGREIFINDIDYFMWHAIMENN